MTNIYLKFALMVTVFGIMPNTLAKEDNIESITIAFGSCSHQDKSLNILQNIIEENADAMLFLGDNIYGDTEDMVELREKYRLLGSNENFIELKQTTPLHAIWDDHDYGENDAGKAYPMKAESKQAFLEFWDVPQDDLRWQREDGIYHAKWLKTPSGKSVHIIFPDLRYNRDDIEAVSRLAYISKRQPKNQGPYVKDVNASKSMLGETQWNWLENELAKSSDIKVLASSLQVLADFTGWEAWHNYPNDINRLFSLIDKYALDNLIIISGDTHWTEISQFQTNGGITLTELTSSGLSEEWKDISPNKNRISEASHNNNYGVIEISFESDIAKVTMGAKDTFGEYLNSVMFEVKN